MTHRPLDADMKAAGTAGMTYAEYLQLDVVLGAQRAQSDPPHHDELLFIIQHQTTELWMKLIVHELKAALVFLSADELEPAFKVLARVKHIQQQLFNQWSVLETLTPSEYSQFRNVLGTSSGFQSVQYRLVEFLLGNRDAQMLSYHAADPAATAVLTEVMTAPSLYDAALACLHRQGVPVPAEVLARDLRERHEPHPGVLEAWRIVYHDPDRWWAAYNLAEKLVDIEENLSLWRFRHMKVVQRVIGFKRGTGGSAGVPFLRKMIDHVFFPELWQVRTEL
jgi:tryptophan 2,3-dioxygenase